MKRIPQSNYVQGGFYHILASGNRNQEIFIDTKDYKKYLERLSDYKKRHNITVIAYCLLPNSISLLLRQNGPEPISTFMQRLHTSYSMHFNKKHKVSGHLFENKYKVKIVNKNEYLGPITKYIHLKASGLVTKLPSYKWSSYPEYISKTKDSISSPDYVLNLYKRRNQTFEDAQLSYKLFIRSSEKPPEDVEKLLFT